MATWSTKKVSAKAVGSKADRDVYAVMRNGRMFKGFDGKGNPKYAITKGKADQIAARYKRREEAADTSGSSKKTSAPVRKKPARKTQTSSKMSVASCRKFLEQNGYTVTNEADEYEDMLRAAGMIENPRKKPKRSTATQKRSTAALKRMLKSLKREEKRLLERYNNDILSYQEYTVRDQNLSRFIDKVELELDGRSAGSRKRNPRALRRLR